MATEESASNMMMGASSKLDNSAASTSLSFSWNHNDYDDNMDHFWTATASEDNASTMATTFPLCVVNINDAAYPQKTLYYSAHHDNIDDGSCPVMVWKILRFVKLVVVRLAHSYYAQRTTLFVLPLLLGLAVGFLWGRWGRYWGSHNRKNDIAVPRRRRKSPSLSFVPSTASLWQHVVLPVVNSVYRLLLKFHHRPETSLSKLHKVEQEESSKSTSGSSSIAIPHHCSGLDQDSLPRHVAIIMDGNRRYGRKRYQNATRGHRDGAHQVLQVAKWCIAETHIQVLTLYAFSTENWNRDPAEIATIMNLFVDECDNVRRQAIQLNVRAYVVSSDPTLIPAHVRQCLQRLEDETSHCTGLQLNICVSYGSRSEIVHACRQVVQDVQNGRLSPSQITEETFARRLLTSHGGGGRDGDQHGDNDVTTGANNAIVDPDILIRTSGETRISNYLLWQIAYAELFFVPQTWPELTHVNFTDILHSYAKERQRRFGR
jgi:undecaprenyl diphosphate synthase